MFAKTNILLLSGWIGSGKSTIAKEVLYQLKERKVEVRYIPFAKELKRIALSVGWDGKKDEKGRQLLIDLGMLVRKYDPFAWAKIVASEIEPEDEVVVVDDWRFPNELDYLKSLDRYEITTVRVARKGIVPLDDTSETSLPSTDESLSCAYYDIIINNEVDLPNSIQFYAKQIIDHLYTNSKQWS